MDVDFMVSHSLNELHHSSWVQTAVAQGALVVIPALEPVMSDDAAQQEVVRVCQGTGTQWYTCSMVAYQGVLVIRPLFLVRFEVIEGDVDC